MGADMVDDLHAAEDRIGFLESALQDVAAILGQPEWDAGTIEDVAERSGNHRTRGRADDLGDRAGATR